jgi:hypothetical protein
MLGQLQPCGEAAAVDLKFDAAQARIVGPAVGLVKFGYLLRLRGKLEPLGRPKSQ